MTVCLRAMWFDASSHKVRECGRCDVHQFTHLGNVSGEALIMQTRTNVWHSYIRQPDMSIAHYHGPIPWNARGKIDDFYSFYGTSYEAVQEEKARLADLDGPFLEPFNGKTDEQLRAEYIDPLSIKTESEARHFRGKLHFRSQFGCDE